MDETKVIEEEAPARRRRNGGDEEITVLRAQVARLTEIVEQVTAVPEDDDPYPLYEVAGPGHFFSRDCVLYPPGATIRDKRGDMPLNQELIPLNAAAERNMHNYLMTLPDHGALTSHEKDDLITQAGYELRNETFASQFDWNKAVMNRALNLKRERSGTLGTARDNIPRMPRRQDPNVPIMSNVRIQQTRPEDRATLGVGRLLPGGARPTAFPAGSETEIYRGATPAALKSAPVFGNVQSQPLGTVGV